MAYDQESAGCGAGWRRASNGLIRRAGSPPPNRPPESSPHDPALRRGFAEQGGGCEAHPASGIETHGRSQPGTVVRAVLDATTSAATASSKR